MLIFKKLIFGLPFILATAFFAKQVAPFLQDFSLMFSLDFNLLYQLIRLVVTIALTAYLFTTLVVLASDWKLVLPFIALASLSTILFVSSPVNIFLSLGLLVVFIISFAQTYHKVTKDATDFNVSGNIIKPSGSLITLIILVTSIALYVSVSATGDKMIGKIVDSVVSISSDIMKTQQLPQDLGINPGATIQNLAIEAAKPLITKQVNDMIKPFLPVIPFLIVFLFYLNLQFLASIAAFILSPLIYLLFWILEKIGFIGFVTENRLVKKLIIQ